MKRGVLPAEVAARNGHMAVARVLSEATAATARAREAEGIADFRRRRCQLPPRIGGGAAVNYSRTLAMQATAGAVELAPAESPVLRPTMNTVIKGEDSW